MRRTSGRLRKAKQKLRRRYTCDREDEQLAGDEQTAPAGAVRDERVDPSSQGDGAPALTAALVLKALREGWPVPPVTAARYVALLCATVRDPGVPAWVKIAASRALLMADQAQ